MSVGLFFGRQPCPGAPRFPIRKGGVSNFMIGFLALLLIGLANAADEKAAASQCYKIENL
jgi:hypothetical protein